MRYVQSSEIDEYPTLFLMYLIPDGTLLERLSSMTAWAAALAVINQSLCDHEKWATCL